jgi:hypothetical protein
MSIDEEKSIRDGKTQSTRVVSMNSTDSDISVRMLKEEAHTQKMADAAVGLGSDGRRSQRSAEAEGDEAMKDVEG